MPAGTYQTYDSFKQAYLSGQVDFERTKFFALLTTSKYKPDASKDSALAHVTDELNDAGYARQELKLSVTKRNGAFVIAGDEDVSFGKKITLQAKYFVIVADTGKGKDLVAVLDLNTAGEYATSENGNFDVGVKDGILSLK